MFIICYLSTVNACGAPKATEDVYKILPNIQNMEEKRMDKREQLNFDQYI